MSEIEFTDANFQSEALDEKTQPVLVDFWAEWCGPCRILGPIIEEVAKEFAGKAKVGKLNVDMNPQIAQKYNVMSIPTLIMFKGGEIVWQSVGVQQKQTISKELSSHL